MKYIIAALFSFIVFIQVNGQAVYPGAEKYFSVGITGDTTDVVTPTKFGVALVGGSTDVDEALQWMIKLSGGGDFVIIRASGSTGYNDYIKELGEINSVETLLIDSREKAMAPAVGKRLREAEAVFIAGGDQWNYVNFWSNSPVSEALTYLIHEKKIPIGGTSAGCAVLSQFSFDARNGSVTSAEALPDPYISQVSITKSFIQIPILEDIIADQHYTQRERHGRHVTFLARLGKDFGIKNPKGIGVDEKTAVCIDAEGNATVFGKNNAYFITTLTAPDVCEAKKPLQWKGKKGAMQVFVFAATDKGTPAFNLKRWPKSNPDQLWSVENGVLQENKVK